MNDLLAPLRAKFLARVASDLTVLRSNEASFEDRHYVVHRLAGAAGTFGYAAVSALAAQLDEQMLADGAAPPQAFAELIAALEALQG